METFSEKREFVDNPRFAKNRDEALEDLSPEKIDEPIRDIIMGLAELSCCFSLQSCCGHFVYPGAADPYNIEPLPPEGRGEVRYRIAYLALCIENSPAGKRIRGELELLQAIDPEFVQFGSPGWFWRRQPNTYAIQVEPERFMTKDEAVVDYEEALHLEKVRDLLFGNLRDMLERVRRE